MKKIKSFCIRAKNFWSPKKLKKRLKQGGFIFPTVAYLGLWLWVAIMMFLLLWAFVSSLKTNYDFIYNPTKLPQLGWRWINYKYALENIPVQLTINGQQVKIGVIQLLLNSLLLGIGNPIVGLIDVSVCSYIAARYKRFKVSKVIFAIVIWMGFVPIGVSLATEFRLLKALGLYNQIWGMWVWSSGGFGGFFLIYYATWKTLSWEYAEAAFIDGAGHFQVFVRIMLPMTMATFGALFITSFVGSWTDYMYVIKYLPSHPTLAYAAWQFQFSVGTITSVVPVKLAGMFVLTFPVLILFIFVHKKLLGAITVGGLKG